MNYVFFPVKISGFWTFVQKCYNCVTIGEYDSVCFFFSRYAAAHSRGRQCLPPYRRYTLSHRERSASYRGGTLGYARANRVNGRVCSMYSVSYTPLEGRSIPSVYRWFQVATIHSRRILQHAPRGIIMHHLSSETPAHTTTITPDMYPRECVEYADNV